MSTKLPKWIVATVTGMALALGFSVTGAPTARALDTTIQITNPKPCTTNTYLYIKTTSGGATVHLHYSTVVTWPTRWDKGNLTVGTVSSTRTGFSTAYALAGVAPTLTSMSYLCA